MNEERLAQHQFDLGTAGLLETGSIFHRYPGKRALLHATLDGRPVVAKFFLAPLGQAWEWWRSTRGSRALNRAGVPSPPLLYAGFCREAGAWLTVLAHQAADEPWPPSETELGRAQERLLGTLAEHHAAGIIQNDLNWLNFIPFHGTLYAIDGDRVRHKRRPVQRRAALAHLRRLYASKTSLPESAIRDGLRHYAACRAWSWGAEDEAAFLQRLRRERRAHADLVARLACRGWKHYPRERRSGLVVIRDRRRLDADTLPGLLEELDTGLKGGYHSGIVVYGNKEWRWRKLSAPRGRRDACRLWKGVVITDRLGLGPERHVALLYPLASGGMLNRGEAILLQEAASIQPLSEVYAVSDAVTCDHLKERLADFLDKLEASRITLTGHGLDGIGWDGERPRLPRAERIRYHWLWHPGFQRHWSRFRSRIDEALEQFPPS